MDAIYFAAMNPIPDNLLNEQEAAAFLRIKPRTLRLWRARRGVPHFKPTSKVVLYRRSDLMAWLEQSRVATISRGRKW